MIVLLGMNWSMGKAAIKKNPVPKTAFRVYLEEIITVSNKIITARML
jgi:hypothetical protein